MYMKKGLICLLIVSVLSLSIINVAAASTSRSTIVPYKGYHSELRSQQQTAINLMILDEKSGNKITTAAVGQKILVGGILESGTDNPTPIGGATVKLQLSNDDSTWSDLKSTTTDSSSKYLGIFLAVLTPPSAGQFYFRASFDGNTQYAPCMSNVAQLTVTSS